ncbi:DUF6197 family protein [Mycobacteroides abscessus]|uniref:DUF6197 family protein n=1 Tax=Mycobacteroides abscessus TaxID=36809 RepID=UPI000C2620D2|nr:hypothetical protein [Mycobacteroides abscessus]RIS67601.1 hypothetical protein D2E70_16665 [Mycobacteroides abscessus]
MSAIEAEQLRAAWDYIERNGFRTGSTGYIEPGDERAACALGALAYTAKLDLTKAPEYTDQFTWIAAETLPAARRLIQARQSNFALSQATDARGIAWAIFRYNDNSVKTLDRARQWFARAIALAEADA